MVEKKNNVFIFDFKTKERAKYKGWKKKSFTLEEAQEWDNKGFNLNGAIKFRENKLTPLEARNIVINKLKNNINFKLKLTTGIYTREDILKLINKKKFDACFL